jgi:hypothetical protein
MFNVQSTEPNCMQNYTKFILFAMLVDISVSSPVRIHFRVTEYKQYHNAARSYERSP